MVGVFIPQESADAENRVIFFPSRNLVAEYLPASHCYVSFQVKESNSSFALVIFHLYNPHSPEICLIFFPSLFSFFILSFFLSCFPPFLPSFLQKQNSHNEVKHPLARVWLEMARLPGTRASRGLPLLLLPPA